MYIHAYMCWMVLSLKYYPSIHPSIQSASQFSLKLFYDPRTRNLKVYENVSVLTLKILQFDIKKNFFDWIVLVTLSL